MSDTARVFLSIDIEDEDLLNSIETVKSSLDKNAAKMKLVERENIHFTLRFFGDVKLEQIETMHSEVEKMDFSAFTIRIQGVGAFPKVERPRVIWIGVSENETIVQELKTELDTLLSTIGYPRERKKYIPHATIARVRWVKDKEALCGNIDSLQDLEIGTMRVEKIRLKKSTLTSSGPIYETLWEKPLRS